MKRIVAIVGPTATGKSSLAVELAQRFDAEIVSADAFQLYKRLTIGTAKIGKDEMKGIIHHLIDVLDPTETFSASDYQKMVRKTIETIRKEGKMPIVVGGSGFYMKAALFDYIFPGEKRNDALTSIYENYSNDELFKMLEEKEPLLAKSIHPNNRRRIIRSLEIAGNGAFESRNKGCNPYYDNTLLIGLKMDRKELYKRIDHRVDQMIAEGLVDEVRALFEDNVLGQAVSAIGYKELYMCFRGEIELDEAIDLIKRNSRRYAKRQMTWFSNQMDVNWFDISENNGLSEVDMISEFIEKKGVDL